MQLTCLTANHLLGLYAFWQEIGGEVPFFYPVGLEAWSACLLDYHQGYAGLRLTPETEQFILAVAGQQIVGFIQFGQPNFIWGHNGQLVGSPNAGIIRHFYYRPDHHASGEALLQQAMSQLAAFDELHAFYQAHGLSCHAWHGKLHLAHRHVEEMLFGHGFVVDQENLLYSQDLCSLTDFSREGLTADITLDEETSQHFAARLDDVSVGTATLHPLDRLTGGVTTDIVYLRWIGIKRELRGQGLGSQFLAELARHYLRLGYRTFHLDTASTNLGAQRFYSRHGFTYLGNTRSYVRR